MKRPAVIAVSGFSSEVGKTTLICDLLRAFPGWEAIKVTRGHYRSCGEEETDERDQFALWRKASGIDRFLGELPIYTREDFPEIVVKLQELRTGSQN
jgi:uridine kinase